MKIVVIIGDPSPPLIHFANTINSRYKIDLLIVEKPASNKKIKNTPKNTFPLHEKIIRHLLFRINLSKKKRKAKETTHLYEDYCKKWFGNSYSTIDTSIPVLEVSDINSPEAQKRIAEVQPDLMLVHGSSIIKAEVLKLAKLALNLHWGLSPYYRGISCTERAIANWDIRNIGVTIHKLSPQIDGGEILGQSRAEIKNLSDLRSATLQLTYLGTSIIIKAIDFFKNGKELPFVKQDFTAGFLFTGMHWDENIYNFAGEINEGLLARMIKFPSRSEVKLVRFPPE